MLNKNFKKTGSTLTLALFIGVLISCSNDPNSAQPTANPAPNKTETLVTVDQTPITQSQLELTVIRTLGNSAALYRTAELDQKILQSLISSRAMAILAEKELDPAKKAELEENVTAYREELLVKQYLQTHAEPTPVSNEAVNEYYQKHQAEFGAVAVKSFEYISTFEAINEDSRKVLIETLDKVRTQDKWQQTVNELVAKGIPVNYKTASMSSAMLPEPLKGLVEQTKVGEVSPVKIGKQIYLVRVNKEDVGTPKALAEVSADIRKKLAPQQMKKAVSQLAEQARQRVKIQFIEQ